MILWRPNDSLVSVSTIALLAIHGINVGRLGAFQALLKPLEHVHHRFRCLKMKSDDLRHLLDAIIASIN